LPKYLKVLATIELIIVLIAQTFWILRHYGVYKNVPMTESYQQIEMPVK
jgi:hypothetical protein